MTSYGSPEIAHGGQRLGAYDVLDKPFDMHELPDVVFRAQETRPH